MYKHPWGAPPWEIHFKPPRRALPKACDFAVVGAGFTGLAAAAWLRRVAPHSSVVVLEATRIGTGASGRTGGMVLSESAAGDLPGLGDVLAGFQKILQMLEVKCDLSLHGAWEIGRRGGRKSSPIEWQDSGTLRVVDEVPGGTLDPGKLVSGLARAACDAGAAIYENHPVDKVTWGNVPELKLQRGRLRAGKVLFATNALSLALTGLKHDGQARLTLAASSAPVTDKFLEEIGLAEKSRSTPPTCRISGAACGMTIRSSGARDLWPRPDRGISNAWKSPGKRVRGCLIRSKTEFGICIPHSRTFASRAAGAARSCFVITGGRCLGGIRKAGTPSFSVHSRGTA